MLGIGLDLLAQPHDAQIHAAVEWVPVSLLVEIQDVFAGEGTVGVLCKRRQINSSGDIALSAVLISEPVCGDIGTHRQCAPVRRQGRHGPWTTCGAARS
jgi:hypothetical protein